MRALNLLIFVQLLLAGLDVGRLHWSATVPLALQILGLVGFATGIGIHNLGHAGQPFLLAGSALAARQGPASRYGGTLPARAPPRLLGWAAVAAERRLRARLLDCHGADPAHGCR